MLKISGQSRLTHWECQLLDEARVLFHTNSVVSLCVFLFASYLSCLCVCMCVCVFRYLSFESYVRVRWCVCHDLCMFVWLLLPSLILSSSCTCLSRVGYELMCVCVTAVCFVFYSCPSMCVRLKLCSHFIFGRICSRNTHICNRIDTDLPWVFDHE